MIASAILLFVIGYVIFQRQEVRALTARPIFRATMKTRAARPPSLIFAGLLES
jgi:hypothetical protein